MKKTALITGASGGLGLSFVNIFARDGYDIVLVARNGNRLEDIKKEIEEKYNVNAMVVAVDLCSEDGAQKVYDATQQAGLNVDVLVNNAGFGDFGKFYKSDINKQIRMVDLNCTALMHLCHLYIPDMIKNRKGNILNVDSIAAFQAGPLMSVYYATKAFVLSFSQALTRELKGTGVKVTALCPGPIRTNFDNTADLGESGLFKNLKVWDPNVVAEFGYKNMKKGKSLCICGFVNKIIVFANRLAPRALVRNMVYNLQKVQ
ncbi:MAG: SDR family oxidoreductase [Clostridia bacterium]|nr:SDR family oxidoreductase [Clostridia bacterium]